MTVSANSGNHYRLQ